MARLPFDGTDLHNPAEADDGRRIMISEGAAPRIYDTADGRVVSTLERPKSKLARIVFSPDCARIQTAEDFGVTNCFDMETARLIARFGNSGRRLPWFHQGLGRMRMVSPGDQGSEIRDRMDAALIGIVDETSEAPGEAWFSPDGSRLLTSQDAGSDFLHDAYRESRPPAEIEGILREKLNQGPRGTPRIPHVWGRSPTSFGASHLVTFPRMSRTALALALLVIALPASGQKPLVFHGGATAERAGHAVVAADLTGDGVDDLVIACPRYTGERLNGGRLLFYFGVKGGFAKKDTRRPDVVIVGSHGRMELGTSLAVGDVNGDGAPDLVAGGPNSTGPAGKLAGSLHVWFGGKGFPRNATIDLFTNPALVTIHGPVSEGDLGSQTLIADLDGDGIGDILSSAGHARPGGQVIGVKGRKAWKEPVIDLAEKRPDLVVAGRERQWLGARLATGDLNGDGLQDLVITGSSRLHGQRRLPGSAVVVSGRTNILSGATIELATEPPMIEVGGRLNLDIGVSAAAGDVDGDGIGDLIVGVPGLNGPDLKEAGGVVVVRGQKDLAEPLVIQADEDREDDFVLGGAPGEKLATTLLLKDLDGSGRLDLIAASPDMARVLVFPDFAPFGIKAPSPAVYTSDDALRTGLGHALTTGDLDGNGALDLIIGAPETTTDKGASTGAVNVYLR